MGGLSRRNTALETLRGKEPTVGVDVGGSLVKSGMLEGPAGPQSRLKAELIAEAVGLGGVEAMTLASTDWQLGAETVFAWTQKYDLPVLAANLECGGKTPFPGFRVVVAGEKKLGFVGITAGRIQNCTLKDRVQSVQAAIKAMGPVDVRILLLPLTNRELEPFMEVDAEIALFLGGGRPPISKKEGPLFFSMPPRGKTLGKLALIWNPEGASWIKGGQMIELKRRKGRLEKRVEAMDRRSKQVKDSKELERVERQKQRNIKALELLGKEMKALEVALKSDAHVATFSEFDLNRTVKDHEETEKRVQRVLSQITEMELGADVGKLVPRRAPSGSAFAGADACILCHPAESKQWQGTPHAKAMTSLVVENHQGDRECVPCHVTGYAAPGGAASPAEVKGLRDVQCEACHGPGAEHVTDPKGKPLAAVPNVKTCIFCHDGVRDEGRFDRTTYWPRVVHSSSRR